MTPKPKRSLWQRLQAWLAGDAEHAKRVEERIKRSLGVAGDRCAASLEPPNGLDRRKVER